MNEMPDNLSEGEGSLGEVPDGRFAADLVEGRPGEPDRPPALQRRRRRPPGPPPATATTLRRRPPTAPPPVAAPEPGEERTCRLGALAHRRLPADLVEARRPTPASQAQPPASAAPFPAAATPALAAAAPPPIAATPAAPAAAPPVAAAPPFPLAPPAPPSGGAGCHPRGAGTDSAARLETLHLERSPLGRVGSSSARCEPRSRPYQRTMVMGTFRPLPRWPA